MTARYLDSLCPGTIDVQVVRENELTVLRGVCPSETSKKKRYNFVVKLGPSGDIKSSCCQCKDSQKPQNRGLQCKHAVVLQHERRSCPFSAPSAPDSPRSECAASAMVSLPSPDDCARMREARLNWPELIPLLNDSD